MSANDLGVPTFGRVEILMDNRQAVRKAARRLRELAAELETIMTSTADEPTALLLAYRKIRAVSDNTRTGK